MESMVKTEENCYKCVYRQTIPGDCHSQCINSFNGIAIPKQNPHGIKNGWCTFPYNFDPVWLGKCEGFTAKEKQ